MPVVSSQVTRGSPVVASFTRISMPGASRVHTTTCLAAVARTVQATATAANSVVDQ